MYYLGLDFSVNFGSACLSKDFKTFEWFSVINGNVTQKFRKLLEEVQGKGMSFADIDSKKPKTDIYHVTERNKLNNQVEVVESLIGRISQRIKFSSAPVIVAIEGYSYGSAGNSLVDIAQATGILKAMIKKELVHSLDQVFVFSPSELKNAMNQKGNCGKTEVFHGFLNDPVIPELRDSVLHKFVSQYKDDIYNGREVKSPIMDCIDATAAVVKLYHIMNGQ